MKTMLSLAAAMALTASAASAAYTPYNPPKPATGAEWLAVCDGDQKVCSDVLFDLIWELGYGERRWAFCLADQTTPEAVTAAAAAWLRARPKVAARPFEAAANAALVATQRCGR